VFISYSFRDRTNAQTVQAALTDAGMQVRMEDEATLIGKPLMQELPRRIANSEVFIQLITSNSAASAWVRREFEWATEHQARTRQPAVILPIVFPDAKPSRAVAKWAYIAAPEGLDPSVLEIVQRTAMRAVELVTLDPQSPYQFEAREVHSFIAAEEGNTRRVVVDPDNLLLRAVDATIEYGRSADERYRQQVVRQQERDATRLERRFERLDAFLPHMMAAVRPTVASSLRRSEVPGVLFEILQRLARLVIGGEVVRLAKQWAVAVEPVFGAGMTSCRLASEQIERLEQAGMYKAETRWALDVATDSWVEIGLAPNAGYADTHLLLPVDRANLPSTQPSAEIMRWEWLRFGVPQVATRALLNIDVPDDAEGVAAVIGWRLEDYKRMGFY
jgi:hypothetical protein